MSTEALLRRGLAAAEALVTPHGIDRYLELVRPTWSTTEVRARITAVEHTTTDSVSLALRPNRNWRGFAAGQHTQLTVEIDGVRHTRCYSITSSAHDRSGLIGLTIKAHPHGTVSRFLVAEAQPGMVVGLTPAQGDFTLAEARPSRLLLISGGSGITPVLSMLRTLVDEGHPGPVTFLHYALTRDQMIQGDEVETLAAVHPSVNVVRVFTDEPGRGDLDGFLTPAQLDAADPDWRTAETYVCGPPPLMDAAVRIFADAGCAERLHVEHFIPPALSSTDAAGSLCFSRSELTVANDGRPVLVQAEAAGLAPRSGCRMGICHTCTRPLRRGAVRNQVTGEVTAQSAVGADVPVRICVNAPVGDTEIDL